MDLVESYAEDLRFARKRVTRALLGLLLLALAVFPLVAPDWMVFLATLVALYAIGVMGQNILIGYTGQISFGQAGFLAIGAFGFGHLRIWGAPFPVALPISWRKSSMSPAAFDPLGLSLNVYLKPRSVMVSAAPIGTMWGMRFCSASWVVTKLTGL